MNIPQRPGPRARFWVLAVVACVVIQLGTFLVLRSEIRKLGDLAPLQAGQQQLAKEFSGIRMQLAASMDRIPPLFGAQHVAIRRASILTQVAQAKGDFVLVAGDSIVEGLYLPRVAATEAVNAGMGGAGLQSVLELMREVGADVKPRGILLAVGVNDAVKRAVSPEFFANWERDYASLVQIAKSLARGNVAVSTIIPVEAGKPLGDQYFDPAMIGQLNAIIRRVAADTSVELIDHDAAFANLAKAGKAYSSDGVHLNRLGYETMIGNLASAGDRLARKAARP